ncbi:B9 protein [Onchocerca flexuosa]|uniref:B9 domain-containing protein 1 n=1 Tax=Onchocerca flexuosa TaxID=387005 RepID=A0A238BUB5_9BILA|nr:B9 protein [Onchocerca flexuosa]
MSIKQSKLSNFIVLLNGQIDSAKFLSFDNFYCKYSYVYGIDWKQVGGIHEGLSARCEGSGNTGVTVGMPIEATFTSTNPFGWPQIVLTCYGSDFFGNDVVCGYGAVHIPTVPGRTIRKIAMFVPEASTLLQRFIGWLTGKRAEFIDPKIVATADGRQVTKVRSQGIIIITMDIVLKDMKKYGYDVVPSSLYRISECPLPDFTKIFDEQVPIRQNERLTEPVPESKEEIYEYELEPGPSNTSQPMTLHARSTRPMPMPRQLTEKSMDIVEEISEGTTT